MGRECVADAVGGRVCLVHGCVDAAIATAHADVQSPFQNGREQSDQPLQHSTKAIYTGRHNLPAPSFILAPQLLAVHLEQSVSILADHGHALLRLAWRNYSRPTMTAYSRDALTEYMGAHLLVAETSGKVSGLPEGGLGRCCGEWRMRKMEIFVKAKMMEMGTVKKRKK